MTPVAVIGASGFIGQRVTVALRDRGADVRQLTAPRLATRGRDTDELAAELAAHTEITAALEEQLRGADVVINAAGMATATGEGRDSLFGANALLPGFVADACARLGARFVHVSSAAVQGRRLVLDESSDIEPFSPYSSSKALGEELVLKYADAIVFRPTSVQGPERDVTRKLRSYATSRVATVASPGDDPTPQVHVANVADAIAFVALTHVMPPSIVLQPTEGITTGELLRMLGGRRPWLMPRPAARGFVTLLFLMRPLSGRAAGFARRLEMLWFGQHQREGWLDGRWTPVVTREEWRELR